MEKVCKSDNKKMCSHRIVWIDLLNICAIIGVCWMHSNNGQNVYDGTLDFSFVWGCAVHSFAIWPVDVFYMITGAMLIGRANVYGGGAYFKRRFLKTGFPFIVWSLIYYLIYSRTTNIVEFIDLFINARFVTIMWFFIPLFAIYISIPFMEIFIVNCERKLIELYLFLSFVLISFFPFICHFVNIHFVENIFPMGLNYLWISVLGYYIYYFDFSKKTRKCVYFLGIISVILNFFGYVLVNYFKGSPDLVFKTNMTPTCIFISVAVFFFFKYHNWQSVTNYSSCIMFISSCTLGVYLMHKLVKGCFNTIWPDVIYETWFEVLGFIPMYLVSLVGIIFIKKIPFLRKIVP